MYYTSINHERGKFWLLKDAHNLAPFMIILRVKRILKAIPDQITDEQIDRYIEQRGKRSKLRNFWNKVH